MSSRLLTEREQPVTRIFRSTRMPQLLVEVDVKELLINVITSVNTEYIASYETRGL